MKKIFVLGVMLCFLLSLVTAVDMTITPQLVHLEYTDSKDVTVCVARADGSPYVGLDLMVTSQCQDLDGDEVYSLAEDGNAVGIFDASVKTSPTGADGCGEVTLTTANAMGGTFAYSINSKTSAGVVVDEEGGLAYIPEFTVLGAGAALAIAGFYIAKKRKH